MSAATLLLATALMSNRSALINSFSPAALFTSGEQGIWLDPSDFSTMFQDLAGQSPVTAAGQSVAIALDKSKGTSRGPELRQNGSAGSQGTVTPATYNTATGQGTFSRVDVANQSYVSWSGLANTIHLVDVENNGSFAFSVRTSNGSTVVAVVNPGQRLTVLVPVALGNIDLRGNNGETSSFTVHSLRVIQGNHATQATAASRPVLGRHPASGLRNLANGSADVGGASWPNTAIGGGITMTKVGSGTDTDGLPYIDVRAQGTASTNVYLTAFPLFQSRCPALVGQTFNASVIVRRIGGSAPPVGAGMFVEVAEETAPSTFIANQASYYPQNEATEVLLSVSRTVATGNQARTGVSMRVDTGLTVDVTYRIKALQFEIGSTRTAFQFNYSSTSVTEPGQPDCHFLAFDGVDDFLVTGTITPGTDKVQAVVGQRKLSDASVAVVIETGPTSSVNNFTLHAPRTAGVGNYGFVFRSDTGGANDVNSASHVAPETAVVTGVSDLSGDLSLIRVNGLEENRKTYDHGVGSFAGHPLYIGRRAGSANAFNGRIYSLVTRFGPNLTAAQIAQTEAWVNSKTRAY